MEIYLRVDLSGKQLSTEKRKIFHTTKATLLYIMKHERPDLETAILFLMRRVSKSDEDDWTKLHRVLVFLQQTKTDEIIIGATSLTDIFTWVDASYAVHDNMRSHMGGIIAIGRGIIHGKSSMQKLNTKSTTEAELVAVSEYLPYNIWMMMFLKEQGYEIKDNILYQDNKSAILLENNGRSSCTGNSRHIDIRYFWVKDRVDKGETKVEYLSTHLMLDDYFTKGLMGSKFRELSKYIMGWRPISDILVQLSDSKIKENVENLNKTVKDNDKYVSNSTTLGRVRM